MERQLVHIESFLVAGVTTRTINTDEVDRNTIEVPETAKIPGLWASFREKGLSQGLASVIGSERIFAVYSEYESDDSGFYDATVGVQVDTENLQSHTVRVLNGWYMVFSGEGPMPLTMYRIWSDIWDYFRSNSHVRRNFQTDFEEYSGSCHVRIYVGVET
ncbi:MAG: GyrI-like domain-containing protein [Alphaproteobacteria bacterium]|nr:GyrI-like domain-containing protein [Alphaproteobacteria bacterium]MCW5749544.1 GyrI-like domain-containing protein [Alphaproteobacteria bacterium]